MTTIRNLMGAGMPGQLATATATGMLTNSLTGAGTSSQAGATLVPSDFAVFTTVALNSGARMPANCLPGDWFTIVNHGANPLLLYPPTGGTIKNGSVNASASIPVGAVAQVSCVNALTFTCATSS